jgi:DNA-binding transcriptional MerR regulator
LPKEREHTIDELARLARTTVRNLRAYQDRGLLPPPRRSGRRGVYTDAHLARTRLIMQLLERGYSLGNIAELIRAWESGRDLEQLLGVEAAVAAPFSAEMPQEIDEQTALASAGNAEILAGALELGLVERTRTGYRVPSPRTLHAGIALIAAGVPWRAAFAVLRTIRSDLEHLATRLLDLVVEYLLGGRAAKKLPKSAELSRLANELWRLRPLAEQVVNAELARALEAAAREQLGHRIDSVFASLQATSKRAPRGRRG